MQVRAARESKGWSQEHLAAASGVSLRTVQRAEAGSRVSPENTLALCATLGIEPSALQGVPTTGPETLPHLQRLRTGLDDALVEFGERPVWQKADASPILLDALRRMGLTPDGAGFAEAERRVRRLRGKLDLAECLFQPLAFGWVIILICVPAFAIKLFSDFAGNRDGVGLLLLCWIIGAVPLGWLVLRHERAWSRIRPSSKPEIEAATIVVTDIRPVEAALTRDFLWVSEMAYGKVRVTRISLPAIRSVNVRRVMDGFHTATFHVEGLPVSVDGETNAIELTRLSDGEVQWLDRRFGALRRAVVWSAAMA